MLCAVTFFPVAARSEGAARTVDELQARVIIAFAPSYLTAPRSLDQPGLTQPVTVRFVSSISPHVALYEVCASVQSRETLLQLLVQQAGVAWAEFDEQAWPLQSGITQEHQ
jgi:hypothetical protein